MKSPIIWLKIAIFFQLATACIHSLSFFNDPKPANETERQMVDLMTTYKMDMGAGFTPTMYQLFNSLSFSFTLLLFFSGIINLYLLRKKVDHSILKGVVGINLLIYAACFIVLFIWSFLPPVVCVGLIFSALFIAFWRFKAEK